MNERDLPTEDFRMVIAGMMSRLDRIEDTVKESLEITADLAMCDPSDARVQRLVELSQRFERPGK